MLPVDMGDGVPVFLLGVRETPADPFRYLRVPADDQGAIDGFVRLRAALADPAAARRGRAGAMPRRPPTRPSRSWREQLTASAGRALALFAGDPTAGRARRAGGCRRSPNSWRRNVPEAERERAGEVLVRILNGALFELRS